MVDIFSRSNAEVDTGTLAALTANLIATLIPDGVVRNLMVKNIKSHFHVSVPNLGDSFIVALGAADASGAEIATALLSTSQDLEDSVAYNDGQNEVRRVWDTQSIEYDGMIAGGSIQRMIQWKLPPKGIPVLKGHGLAIFCFNTDTASSFSNGPSFKHQGKIMGGWF